MGTRICRKSEMIAFSKQHPFVAAAAGVVTISWISWFVLALFWGSLGPREHPMETFGQFGDTFGVVNALFTGLALVGVVYAAVLQHDQVETQRQELKQQSRDSELNRQALTREKREQFVTARLNATQALLHARQAESGLSSHRWEEFQKEKALLEAIGLRQRISIMLCEASFGLDDGDWNVGLERKAIRKHLIVEFQGLLKCLAIFLDPRNDLNLGKLVIDTKYEMQILAGHIKERHEIVAFGLETFCSQIDENREGFDRNAVVSWFQGILQRLTSGSDFMWQ
jgi:hypothetical protein